MLKISKLADYGTVMLSIFAQEPLQVYSAAQIAQKTHFSVPTVSKVLKLLNEADLVTSTRGVNGGYQLAKSAEQISIADVISAIDGKPALTQCSKGVNICQHDQVCVLRHRWQAINQSIMNFLGAVTLAEMSQSTMPSDKLHFPRIPIVVENCSHDKK